MPTATFAYRILQRIEMSAAAMRGYNSGPRMGRLMLYA